MNKVVGVLSVLLLFSGASATCRADDLPAYAPVKKVVCRDCVPDHMFPGVVDQVPRHGIVTTEGTLSNIENGWTIVDFDTRKLTRLRSKWDKTVNPAKLMVWGKTSVDLNEDQLKRLIVVANNIWNPPGGTIERPASSTTMVSISLLDGDEIYDDSYLGQLPPDLAGALITVKTPLVP